ncbi:DNA-binding protein WhiA [Anaerosporobacter faecicola]|uniref:DNA-binding protein WhiA n=1 Tax=Anaerosporobacter faecicola TaxID=2718714 RepID=UPI00143B4704|nr:DNA-binding protein WhiA [Anaerosporobacter faecicola]
MSFSKEIKEELSNHITSARHCQIAEIAAIISLCGRITISVNDEYRIKIHTENLTVARKFQNLLIATFQVKPEVSLRRKKQDRESLIYIILVKSPQVAKKILRATRLIAEDGDIRENLSIVDNIVVQNTCCKRAFIRGAFIAAGSMSDPSKAYHFEIALPTRAKAVQLRDMLHVFQIDAKIVQRKRYFIVYVKEGSQIVDVLNVMEAHIALMNLENVRILKEMRNSINRQVNCETANINKTVAAASKQAEDILFIKELIGFGDLDEGLKEVAVLRLEHPEASLKELGLMLETPIGKSGVNHRLRKLSIIADNLREHKEEKL